MNGRRGFHQLILIIKKISTLVIFWNVEITNFWVVILFQRQYKVKIIFLKQFIPTAKLNLISIFKFEINEELRKT